MVLNLVFDLDGTLYSFGETGIGKQMRTLINEFVGHEFQLSPEQADAMSEDYYHRYGLTARGIQIDRNVSSLVLRKYVGFVHLVDLSPIKFNPELVAAMAALNATPNVHLWILTNATKQHAAACLAQLGISNSFRCPSTGVLRIMDCFDQWALAQPDCVAPCKPLRVAYEHAATVAGAKPGDRFVMVEDAIHNLDAPKAMGWRTVFIHDGRMDQAEQARQSGHDVIGRDIMEVMPRLLEFVAAEAATAATATSTASA